MRARAAITSEGAPSFVRFFAISLLSSWRLISTGCHPGGPGEIPGFRLSCDGPHDQGSVLTAAHDGRRDDERGGREAGVLFAAQPLALELGFGWRGDALVVTADVRRGSLARPGGRLKAVGVLGVTAHEVFADDLGVQGDGVQCSL